MKNNIIYIVLFILCVVLGGCSKHKNNTTGSLLMSAVVKTTTGQKNWQTNIGIVNIVTYPTLRLIIEGDNTTDNIHVEVNNYTGPGTYSLSNDKVSYYGTYSNPNQVNYGQVTIDTTYQQGETNTVIIGSFNFTTDTRDSIQGGQFTATLILN